MKIIFKKTAEKQYVYLNQVGNIAYYMDHACFDLILKYYYLCKIYCENNVFYLMAYA